MYANRLLPSGLDVPGNLAHLDGLRLNAGNDRIRLPGSAVGSGRSGQVSAARQAQLERRHAARVRDQDAADPDWRRQRHEQRTRSGDR